MIRQCVYGHLMPGGREELRERLDVYLGKRLDAGSGPVRIGSGRNGLRKEEAA